MSREYRQPFLLSLFVLFVFWVVPGFFFYVMGGWDCVGVFAVVEGVRLFIETSSRR